MSGAPALGIEVRRTGIDDPLAEPLVRELTEEYVRRYGPGAYEEMTRYPADSWAEPHGLLLLLLEDGEPVAGGAYRRYDARTAELKRMWTSSAHRRRGLASRVLAELERAADAAGYRRIYLTTGPRQPEAKALYLAAGYTPLFDLTADPEAVGPLPFEKHLP
ncbi:GNAT family N-acetyltransferase [Kitasatospora misakiensis]|uniref:GNAT family N-acetyltransferase n=1 Tax=Kitasatospora misakiensis TaxID=67330 RepID=A0ABW0XFP3_9ACTN